VISFVFFPPKILNTDKYALRDFYSNKFVPKTTTILPFNIIDIYHIHKRYFRSSGQISSPLKEIFSRRDFYSRSCGWIFSHFSSDQFQQNQNLAIATRFKNTPSKFHLIVIARTRVPTRQLLRLRVLPRRRLS